jgi:flagellar basal-body rod modification protein FlgD
MESAEFAAQLAQFNQVEQLIGLNEGIESLGLQQEIIGTGLSNTLAASITGKNVRVQTDIIGFEQGEDTKIGFTLGSQASDVQLTIRDQNGSVLRTETFNNLPAGQHAFEWDGKSDSGITLPDGAYQVEIQALNGDDAVNAFTFTEGIATRIRYTENGVQLQVNGLFVNLGQVEEIGLAPE